MESKSGKDNDERLIRSNGGVLGSNIFKLGDSASSLLFLVCVSGFCSWKWSLKGTSLLFFHDFQIPRKIKSDWAEIFTRDRALKMTGYVFEGKFCKKYLHGFLFKKLVSRGLHLDTGRGVKKSSDWAEIFFGGTYRYISEVLLTVF